MDRLFQRRVDPSAPFSVAEINANVRALLESGWSGVCVEAEVGDVKRAQSGHIYFTLSDRGGRAQLPSVMWRGQAMRYGSRIVSGAQIRCVGRLTLYEARGSFQMVVESATDAGAGLKAQRLEALKQKLLDEGLFDRERKRPLPAYPAVVGIVTSRQGAAFRDIVKVARRRFPVRLIIAHAQVQGEAAPAEITDAIALLERQDDVEVIIVGRGGGSAEDLDAFNDEAVVRAVAGCPKPVISAVGHEIDTTLTDLAADRRAATPSEAAELAVPDARAAAERIAQAEDALVYAIEKALSEKRVSVTMLTGRARTEDPRVRLQRGAAIIAKSRETMLRIATRLPSDPSESLAAATQRLHRWPEPRLLKAGATLSALDESLRRSGVGLTKESRSKLAQIAARLDPLSPLASLSRGYAVVQRTSDQKILRNSADAPPGTDISVTLAEGSLSCRVTDNNS